MPIVDLEGIQVDVDEEKNKIVFTKSEPISKKSRQHADA